MNNSKFTNFLLNEKVSRDEIADALSSKNVMVGAEFEFIIPDFSNDYYDDLMKIYKVGKKEDVFQEYDDALELWQKDPKNNSMPELPDWAKRLGYKPGDEIVPSKKVDTSTLNPKIKELWNILINDYLMVKDPPFPKPHITMDNKAKSGSKWIVKPDGSLGLAGVEVVTPVLTLQEFLSVTPKVFEYINKFGDGAITNDCGFHISISLKNVSHLGEKLDITKLSLFLDEGYIYNFFKMREFNTYAQSAFDAVRGAIISQANPHLMKELVDEEKLKKGYSDSHYMAINIEHLDTKNEYIEFRYIGGKNYHHKWDRIKAIVAHYVHTLSLACDPTFKVKEYESKMARVLNKIQFFTVCIRMTEMVESVTDKKELMKSNEWGNLFSVWSALKEYKSSLINKGFDEKGSGKRGFDRLCRMLKIDPKDIIWDFTNVYKKIGK
jgi:hypothetical protein